MTRYRHGDHNVICDQSGFKVKASQTMKRWDGMRVRITDWEPRHPQDFVKGKRDRQAVSDPRPEGTDTFLTENQITKDDL